MEGSSPAVSPLKQPRDTSTNEGETSPIKKSIDATKIIGRPIEIVKGKSHILDPAPAVSSILTKIWILIYIDKLYWVSDSKPPQNYKNAFFFNIDNDLTYFPFNKDFGPLNLAMVHRFSRELARLLKDKNYS